MSTSEINRDKISAAVETLTRAAKEKKDDFKKILSEQYGDFLNTVADALRNDDVIHKVQQNAQNTLQAGKKKVADLDRQVRENPWRYIGTAAVGALIMGYFLKLSRR